MAEDRPCENYVETDQDCVTAGFEVIAADGLCGPCAERLLPKDILARIVITKSELLLNLPQPMSGKQFAALLLDIADDFENGTAKRIG